MAQAAERLGTWPSTITRWCESGKLPAIPKSYGSKTSYLIAPATIDLYLTQLQTAESRKGGRKQQSQNQPHPDFVAPWVHAMAEGLLTGKPYSERTVSDYKHYIELYFKRFKAVSIDNLKAGLTKIPADSVAVRQHYYKAVRCFAKYLISEGALEPEFIERAKPLSPKYHKPPKRHTVTADGLEAILKACETVTDLTLVTLLASTGLRASELCNLQFQDIHIKEGTLTVHCGKGGKMRRVGLSANCREVLERYIAETDTTRATRHVFLNTKGKPLNRSGIYQRLERIGKRAGTKVSPHSLRRAFVTHNANLGRPLQMLQMACGHSDIKTTMGYCRTSERDLIEAMRDW